MRDGEAAAEAGETDGSTAVEAVLLRTKRAG